MIDVAGAVDVIIAGRFYRLSPRVRAGGVVDEISSTLAIGAVDTQDTRAQGRGYVRASVECVHAYRCWVRYLHWNPAEKKKTLGPCNCGAQAAMDALLARGRA